MAKTARKKSAKKAATKRAKTSAKNVASKRGSAAAARAPRSPIFISGPNGEEERCDWNPQRNAYDCVFLDAAAAVPRNATLVHRAAPRPAAAAAAAAPRSPIFISGPNGEEERCDWNPQRNAYDCVFLDQGAAVPQNAVLVHRARE